MPKFQITALVTSVVLLAIPFIQAKAEEAPTPTPEVIVIEVERQEGETAVKVKQPDIVIVDYKWSQDVLDTYAKLLYGLDTKLEKHIAIGICINRYFSTQKNSDGTLVFGNSSITSLVNSKEFAFYDKNSPITEDNLFMANEFLNERMTAFLTKQYTGFVFPTTALYFGWTEERDIAVYSELRGEPLVVYDNHGTG